MAPRNFTDSEEAQIAAIYQSGISARAIARAYGFRFHISIVDALRRQGVTQRPAPERNRLYALDAHAFDVIDNEVAAYWWGFLYADGYVGRRTLTIHLKASDGPCLSSLSILLKSSAPLRTYQTMNCHNCHIEFTDRHLTARLRDLGIITHRPHSERVWNNLPPEMIHHWVRGFFDGDGSARKAPGMVFCGKPELLSWLRAEFAGQTGTNPALAITKHRTANLSYLYISGIHQALKIARYMYHDATLYLPRKKAVVDGWPAPQMTEYKLKWRTP
jgi:hypothetical protein